MDKEFKSNFIELDIDKLRDLKHKKWFELNDMRKAFPDIHMFIIKGKKNIGKSYALLQEWENLAKQGKKFLFLRITEGEAKEFSKEISESTTNPFIIKANRIYYNGENCGLVSWVKNLQRTRSLQFEGYSTIFFDEYVAFDEKTYGSNDLMLARNIVRLIMDVQRNKSDLEVWFLGNNDIQVDLFTKYFKLNIYSDIQVDYEASVAYINLRNLYEGVSKSLATGLAFYDKQLDNYLSNNNTMGDISLLSNYLAKDNSFIRYALVIDNTYYLYTQKAHKYNEKGVEKVQLINEWIITHTDKEEAIKHNILAFRNSDSLQDKKVVQLSGAQKDSFVELLFLQIKFGMLKFTDKVIENNIIRFIDFNRNTFKKRA